MRLSMHNDPNSGHRFNSTNPAPLTAYLESFMTTTETVSCNHIHWQDYGKTKKQSQQNQYVACCHNTAE